MSITFAIPFYKDLDFLQRALRSLQNQTNPNWTAIVVNDNPFETAAEKLVRDFGDARIRFEQNEKNLGMVGCWNRCLELSTTPLTTLLHADDELMPNYTDLMLEAFGSDQDASVFFCFETIIDRASEKKFSIVDQIKILFRPKLTSLRLEVVGEKGLVSLLNGNFICCPTMCFVKSNLDGQRFDASFQMVQDRHFTTTLLLKGKKIVGLPVVAYRYRRHSDNATQALTQSGQRFKECHRLYDSIAAACEEVGWQWAQRVAHKKRYIKMHLFFLIAESLLKGRLQKAFFFAKQLRGT